MANLIYANLEKALEIGTNENKSRIAIDLLDLRIATNKLNNATENVENWMKEHYPEMSDSFLLKFSGNLYIKYSEKYSKYSEILLGATPEDISLAVKDSCITSTVFDTNVNKIYNYGWEKSNLFNNEEFLHDVVSQLNINIGPEEEEEYDVDPYEMAEHFAMRNQYQENTSTYYD